MVFSSMNGMKLSMERILINADDFGLNNHCTEAICEAFHKGLITDTTMVANGDAFEYALSKLSSSDLREKVGIHFNLTEGKPLTPGIMCCRSFSKDGFFRGAINRLKPLSKVEREAVYAELSAQVKRLQENNIYITHADSHHHIHTAIFIAPIIIKVCKENGIKKIRLHRNVGSFSFLKTIVKKCYNNWLRSSGFTTTNYFGSLQDIEIIGLFDKLEIMVHPDYDNCRKLIDRSMTNNGIAIGNSLHLPVVKNAYKLINYEEL